MLLMNLKINQGVSLLNKVKIYELAREMGQSSKDMVNIAREAGINIENHLSSLETEGVTKIKEFITNKEKPQDKMETKKPKVIKETKTVAKDESPKEVKTVEKPKAVEVKPEAPVAAKSEAPVAAKSEAPMAAKPTGTPAYTPNATPAPTAARPASTQTTPGSTPRPAGTGQGYQGGQGGGYQGGQRPAGQGYQGGQGGGYQGGQRPAGQGYQGGQGGGYQGGQRPAGQGYQGGQGGGYQGGQRPAGQGYQGGQGTPGTQGTGGQGGYQGGQQRPAGQGYQGNRPSGTGGGYGAQRKPFNSGSQNDKDRDDDKGGFVRRNDPNAFKPNSSTVQPVVPRQKVDFKKTNEYDQKVIYSPELEEEAAQHAPKKTGEVAKLEKINKKPVAPRPQARPQARPQGRHNNYNNNRYGRSSQPQIKREDTTPKKPIKVGESITVKDLGEKLGKTVAELIKKLFTFGLMATINQEIDYDTAVLIASEFKVKVEKAIDKDSEEVLLYEEEDKPEELKPRPPVVTIMGHVDHGKTSLLDAIRSTNVIATEAGGITQHIGAYTVTIAGKKITFLDTPGHEAFTSMRARGAKVTDIAILVVAADDGIMPQTIEAINHAKEANVAIIVAINKIDKDGANVEKVKQELTEYGVLVEEWGGDTIAVPVSAKKRIGIDNLLEMILLSAEMQELKANPKRKAVGTVIEAQLDKGKGPVATILIQNGTLNIGDYFIVGSTHGKIRAMLDDKGKKIKKAGPSVPVEIHGLSEVPEAGDIFTVVEDEKVAKNIADKRRDKQKMSQLSSNGTKVTLEDLFNQIQEGKLKELKVIVKADVQGSVEAVKQSLSKLSNDEVKVLTIHGGVGAINETDVMLAAASNAIIIGFNVRPQSQAAALAEKDNVEIKLYRVIYNAIEDIEAAMKGMLEPQYKEVIIGHAEIRQIFKATNIGTIAGCMITDGKITRNSEARILRDSIVVYEGKLASLKRFKDDAKEVAAGYECGLNFEKFTDFKEGDIVEAFIQELVPRK